MAKAMVCDACSSIFANTAWREPAPAPNGGGVNATTTQHHWNNVLAEVKGVKLRIVYAANILQPTDDETKIGRPADICPSCIRKGLKKNAGNGEEEEVTTTT